jgi:hypothetical protein
MSLFGDISGAVNSATTSVGDALSSAGGAVSNFLSSGPASALSAISGAVGGVVGGITGVLNAFGTTFKTVPGIKLPLPNPLFGYATYDYVLGLGVLTKAQLNKPDTGYMKGQRIPLIAKSANADPSNRVKTAYGQFDFFLDKLEIESTIGLEKGHNTNMHTMSFQVTEPYSMGMFMMSVQQAAWDAGHDNYTQAPFLLTIDFRGNTETGIMANISGASRKIPFRMKDVSMSVTDAGAVYQVSGFPVNSEALSSHVSEMKTDGSITGLTVQEVLQTGEKSLQVMLNKRLQQLKTDNTVNKPDQIVIMFPVDISSEGTAGGGDENADGATTLMSATSQADVASQLKLTQSTVVGNETLVQQAGTINMIGKAKMGFGEIRKGDTPVGKDNKVYDANGNPIRSNNTVNKQISDMKFSQDTDITTAIDAVLMNSEYVNSQLQEDNIDKEGMRKWWRIDTQVYQIDDPKTQSQTNIPPRIIVYRIVPYGVHTSAVTAVGKKAPGFAELEKQVVKVYDYIYTGKNVDVISFNINFKVGFTAKMAATASKRTQDAQRQEQASGADDGKNKNDQPIPDGEVRPKNPGENPQGIRHTGTDFKDKIGGGGLETEQTRAAKQFHNAITSASGMLNLDLKIIGDPYFIAQSGMGNYTSSPTQYSNLNADGSVSYQNSEVDIKVNFRTPVDLNQTTGLFDFGKSAKTAPVLTWSGIYRVTSATSHFEGGQFTQTLKGTRRNGQEYSGEGSSKNTLNATAQKPNDTKDE